MIIVIIPILNAMPYMPEAFASLEAQTFKDFEVCLWDNGSTDGSVEEAMRWIPGRLKGRVVSGNPLPLHECLARMVEEAQTEFVARMDGDDVCLPERFQKQIQYLNQNPDVAVLGAQCLPIDARGMQLHEPLHFPESFVGVLSKFMIGNAVLHPSVVFRKSSILEAGNYKLYEKPCEDLDLWLRVASRHKITSLPDQLLKYRLHESSVTGKAKHDELLDSHVLNCLKRHTRNLFGIGPEDYARLRSKRYTPSLFPILRAAKCIQARCGIPIGEVLGQSDFIWSARCLTARIDWISRFSFGIFERCYS